MEKLTKIQNELKAPKNQYNSFGKYKYRSCEDILEALKPLLEKHKCTLTITDEIKQIGDIIYVEATALIVYDSGKKIEETPLRTMHEVKAQAGITPNKKGMDLSQSFGSSSSYARKYALNGLFLIDDTKDADSRDNSKEGTKNESKPKTKPNLIEGTKIWEMAVEKLAENKTTIEKIQQSYTLTEEQIKKLKK